MRIIFALLLIFFLFAFSVAAQGSRHDGFVITTAGRPVAGASVRICPPASPAVASVPCPSTVLLYSNNALTDALSNPTTTNAAGNYHFYSLPGRVDIQISAIGIQTYTQQDVQLPSDALLVVIDSLTVGNLNNIFFVDGVKYPKTTAGIQAAIDDASAVNGIVYITAGTYNIIPATASTDETGAVTVAFVMRSNMHIECARGATLRLADNQSTDAAPKALNMFHTNAVLSNVSIRGCILDMNGANNPISPSRPTTYDTGKLMAHFSVSGTPGGVAARIDDVILEYNTFQNTSGTNDIVAGHSNTAGIVLGKNWVIVHNIFKNNGLDTSDHTAVYGWSNNMTAHDNIFWQDSPYGTVGKTGASTAYEVHGFNHTFHDNIIYNYQRMAYVANNYTSDVYNANIHDNVAVVQSYGVTIFRSGASALAVHNATIYNNVIRISEQVFTGGPAGQILFDVQPALSVSNIKITNNHVSKTGANTLPAFFSIVAPPTGQSFNNVRVNNNSMIGLTSGILFRTNFGGSLGYVEATGNELINFAPVAGNVSIGVYAEATNIIKTLVIDGNRFIDERGGSATFEQGVHIQDGTITDLYVGPQVYKGLITADYTEAGGISITNREPTTFYGLLKSKRYASNGTVLVAGDFVLSAGWGSGAAVSAVTGSDSAFDFTITAGTTPGVSPTITPTFKDGTWIIAPVCKISQRGGTGAHSDLDWILSATAPVFTWLGTPVNGLTYIFNVLCMGKAN